MWQNSFSKNKLIEVEKCIKLHLKVMAFIKNTLCIVKLLTEKNHNKLFYVKYLYLIKSKSCNNFCILFCYAVWKRTSKKFKNKHLFIPDVFFVRNKRKFLYLKKKKYLEYSNYLNNFPKGFHIFLKWYILL